MTNMEYMDISPLISEKIAVFPGDTSFKREILLSQKKGHHLDLSTIHTTVHLGAHTDAPSHYHAQGVGIDQRDLNYYLGPCQVIEVDISKKARIEVKHLANKKINCERVLFKTRSFPQAEKWVDDFNSLSPELIYFLAREKVKLVGIDTPSVDPADSKDLPSHLAIYEKDMAILEGIILDQVKEGNYFLIALPLKIKDADASPVRAILLPREK